jgi:hypothetical protein
MLETCRMAPEYVLLSLMVMIDDDDDDDDAAVQDENVEL